MSVFPLDERLVFPDPSLANADGLLAIGGDLSVDRLLLAYKKGIFPWFTDNKIPFWYSPDPRCVIYPDEIHISHSMQQLFHQHYFTVTFDTDFSGVIKQCAIVKRKKDSSSWISKDFQKAYINLHKAGYAHSVEVWKDEELVGGLYGVSLGKCFFGESMFSKKNNASKYALISLAQKLLQHRFLMIDCQLPTEHLQTLGGKVITREEYLAALKKILRYKTLMGPWSNQGVFSF
ncbi:MAG: leucyl/phenylalanyl-tRNA--protein transferase [Chitinophagales bacterium]|nr:leucyl/phenylalanyl-tRNA--protein transferase [Chitinophagales bacterium]